MTEATHQMTCNPLPPGVVKPGSVGVATGIDVTILDSAGSELPKGMRGEVAIRGATVVSVNQSPHVERQVFGILFGLAPVWLVTYLVRRNG